MCQRKLVLFYPLVRGGSIARFADQFVGPSLVFRRQRRLAGAGVVDLVAIGPFFIVPGKRRLKIQRHIGVLARQGNSKSRQRFSQAMRVEFIIGTRRPGPVDAYKVIVRHTALDQAERNGQHMRPDAKQIDLDQVRCAVKT